MNRRDFLKFTVATATAAVAAVVTTVLAPAQAAYVVVNAATAPHADAAVTAWEIPPFPCREIIRQASKKELMAWWAKYGAGTQAGFFRGVPRKYVRFWLLHYHGVIAPEKFYG
jgi:hypothetical protein